MNGFLLCCSFCFLLTFWGFLFLNSEYNVHRKCFIPNTLVRWDCITARKITYELSIRKLRRSGFANKCGITNDADAIAWCIEEGNSTKKYKSDGWEQSIPEDSSGNPMPGVETAFRGDGNHHMGIGLAKLVKLVKDYSGQLWLASGNSLLTINGLGNPRFDEIQEWNGVAISCRFNFNNIAKVRRQDDDIDWALEKLVRGES